MSRLTDLANKLWKDELAIVSEDEELLKEMMAKSGETYRGDMADALRYTLPKTHAAHPPMPGVDKERYPITWTGGRAPGKSRWPLGAARTLDDMIPPPPTIATADLPDSPSKRHLETLSRFTGMPRSPMWVSTTDGSGTTITSEVDKFKDVDPDPLMDALMAKSHSAAADPISETIKYLRKKLKVGTAFKSLDKHDQFVNLLKAATAKMRTLGVADEEEARGWAKVWTHAHGNALKLAMLGAGEALREVCERNVLALPGGAGHVTFTEITDVERTLAPKSEHSSEADLARTLDQVALVEDPEYGVF